MSLVDRIGGKMFNFVHQNNLVYNTCWEDPRLDRVALKLTESDRVLVITSAGCNTLDYVLAGAGRVDAVDMNPRQNALLELKRAGIRTLDYDTFFRMFGNGRLPAIRAVYRDKLRPELSHWAQGYWDRYIKKFFGGKKPFYFRGTAGYFARMMNFYVDQGIRIRRAVNELIEARTIEEQQRIYHEKIRDRFWTALVRFIMRRDTTLALLGVPRAQRYQIETQYEGGVAKYVRDCLEAVVTQLPIQDNYFWRVYLTGSYTPECCPEYLKPEGFARLKEGLVERIGIHTQSVEAFLNENDVQITRFVLLDHMDWLSTDLFPLLELEWNAIFRRAAPGARAIWRSGGLQTDFLNRVEVCHQGRTWKLPELWVQHTELAHELHQKDRVHTYASFYIADLKV